MIPLTACPDAAHPGSLAERGRQVFVRPRQFDVERRRTSTGQQFGNRSVKREPAANQHGVPVTAREQPYGTPELVAEILQVLDGHKLVIMRQHGFVSLGGTMEEHAKKLFTIPVPASPDPA